MASPYQAHFDKWVLELGASQAALDGRQPTMTAHAETIQLSMTVACTFWDKSQNRKDGAGKETFIALKKRCTDLIFQLLRHAGKQRTEQQNERAKSEKKRRSQGEPKVKRRGAVRVLLTVGCVCAEEEAALLL
jgi:hypothetical protein